MWGNIELKIDKRRFTPVIVCVKCDARAVKWYEQGNAAK